MRISGLQRLSLIDYPNLTSAVIFFEGCDFRCPYCYNEEVVKEEATVISEKEVLAFLEKRKKMLDGVVLSGGEPLYNRDLTDFIIKVRAMGYDVKLDTNGYYPDKVAKLLNMQLLNYIALDVKTSLEKYSLVCDKPDAADRFKKTLKLVLSSKVELDLRTTCAPGVVEEADFYKIANMVEGAKLFTLQQFRSEKTLDKSFTGKAPYSSQEMFKFKEILQEKVQTVEIKGLDNESF